MTDFPIVIAKSGLLPQLPAALRAQLLALVSATNPGYTANLPGSLIEDISSTDVGALAICDQAKVETVNSLTPLGANAFVLTQLGTIYGVELGAATNTSVYVQFSGPPGWTISKGFLVSDGTYTYAIQDGGIIGSGGTSPLLFAVAQLPGTWSIAPGTVINLVTSIPSSISPTPTVTNPSSGIPAAEAQSEESYRAEVLQAGLAASQGMSRYLKTLLENVSGVQPRLVSVRASGASGYEVIVGGGDPYEVAYAIFQAVFWLPGLVGSTINVTAASKAAAAVITTDLNHGLTDGQTGVVIAGALGMTGINGTWTVTVITEKTFSIVYDSTSAPTYTGGGVVTPNDRNVVATISDYPDTYDIPFVIPPQQTVEVDVVWNTTAVNFVSPDAIAQLAAQPIVDYVNSIAVGQPINVLTLDQVFRDAVSTALPPELVTRLVFTVEINGVATNPTSGTQIIEGDPESFFFSALTNISVTQG